MAGITKEAAMSLVRLHLKNDGIDGHPKESWHFGRCELAELLNLVYDCDDILPAHLSYWKHEKDKQNG